MNTATQLRICAISLALLCACAKATAPDAAPASDAQNAAANVQAALSDAAAADTAVSDDTGDAPKNTEQDSDVAAAADIASPVYNVVFFGNSYTYVNDLPTMVAKFAAEDGVTVKVDSWTGGGATMAALFLNVDVQKLLAKGGWTHVVLQGQSMETAYGAAYLLEYCKKFADLIKPSKANLVWYSTWPRRPGDPVYADQFAGGTPQKFADIIAKVYQQAADANGGVRVHATEAWAQILAQHPEMNLYQADGSHPLPAGTYLVACVFAATVFGVQPLHVTWHPAEVSDADALILRQVCSENSPKLP